MEEITEIQWMIRKIRARVRNLTIESDRERTRSFKEIVELLDRLNTKYINERNISKR